MRNLGRLGLYFCFLISVAVGQNAAYEYVKVAEISDPFTLYSIPAITESGAVYFVATKSSIDINATPQVTFSTEVFRFQGGSLTKLESSKPGRVALDVSPNGIVLYLEKIKGEPYRLILDRDGDVSTILDSSDGPFSSVSCATVNGNGDVAFVGIQDDGLSGFFLRSAGGETLTLVGEVDLADLSVLGCNQFSKLRLNKDLKLALVNGSERAAFLFQDGKLGPVGLAGAQYAGMRFSSTECALNEAGTVIFGGSFGAVATGPKGGLFRSVGGGPAELVASTTGNGLPSPRIAALNDRGDIAYIDTDLNTFSLQVPFVFLDRLRLLRQGATVPETIVKTGDVLFGGTVGLVGFQNFTVTPRYMNNAGQIAFLYSTTVGKGIAVATPKAQ